jgi:exodeoxyribonuclease V alpha subunit
MTAVTFEVLKTHASLRDIDIQFAQSIARICKSENPYLILGAALASYEVSQGHICANLPSICERPFVIDEDREPIAWPSLTTWVDALKSSSAVSTAGDPRPLYLDEKNRLYLSRYWSFQIGLVNMIKARLEQEPSAIDQSLLIDGLERLFDLQTYRSQEKTNWQAVAAIAAVYRNFSVISGGPGTGKTSAVVRILALLFEQAQAHNTAFPRVSLMAPTGKAAGRLEESIERAKLKLKCRSEIADAIPHSASTIHRGLKGSFEAKRAFHYHRDNPLPADVVIVDEASMIPLTLMHNLFDAVPMTSKLILLGDEHQLASVQAGAILGDICNAKDRGGYSTEYVEQISSLTGARLPLAKQKPPAIRDAIVQLKESHRFKDTEGIGALARAIKAGESAEVLKLLKGDEHKNIHLINESKDAMLTTSGLICEGYEEYLRADTIEEKLISFNQFRILCAHRRGELGSEKINGQVATILGEHFKFDTRPPWYRDQPVMVQINDYRQKLYNGDIGIVGTDSEDEQRLVAWFHGSDGELRAFYPSRLPPHESVYAMTIHKSQGSEFDKVLVILPAELSPILSRELLYTAVTRASKEVFIMATDDVISQAVDKEISRASGLTDSLWSD